MGITEWVAVLVIFAVVYCLIKRYETRLVLIGSGLLLCLISWNLVGGLNAFAKSMTNASLVMAICGSMGFAFVAKYTEADRSLVHYLSAPIRGLGIFLVPVCTAIPVMLRAGIKPAGAAAAVLAGTIGSYLSPGTSHNPYVANMAHIDVMEFIGFHAPYSIMIGAFGVIGTLIMCILLGDGKGDKNAKIDESKAQKTDDFTPNPIKALVPLVPITILVVGNLWCPFIKMGVAQAMVLGAVIALAVARPNPETFTKEFFNGCGKGYADVMGIIIAAGVFAAGLREAGLIDVFVQSLKESNEIARWGGSIGPFIMGVITGSGDAATLAFNETVTPHAEDFGMSIQGLGGLAFLAGAAGRTASPLAGVTILVSGIAMVSPIEVIKRTALPMLAATIVCALIMV